MSAESPVPPLSAPGRRWRRWLLLVLGPVVVVAGAGTAWLVGGRYVITDDASVEADKITISSDVPGIVAAVLVPKPSPSARFGYFKFCRKTGEFPEASAAVLLDPEHRLARLFVGALAGAPQPLDGLAHALAETGAAPTQETIAAAIAAASFLNSQIGA